MTYITSESWYAAPHALQPPASEETYVQAAQRGDLEAFNALVLMHQARAYNLAYRLLGDEAAAADATQEAFIRAYQHIRAFQRGAFFTWLYRIVANVCYDLLRYQKRRPALPFTHLSGEAGGVSDYDAPDFDAPAPEDDGPETIIQRRELAALLQQHINTLPIDQRLALVLSDVQGLSYQEIAEVTRSNLGTVKSRLSRARTRLRRSLSAAQLAL